MIEKLILIGAGGMSVDYAKVLKAQQQTFDVICRSKKSAEIFFKKTGIRCHTGGIEKFLDGTNRVPSHAIVSVGVEMLFEVSLTLLNAGVKNLLVEKPGALFFEDIEVLSATATELNANVYIAYNRRFYASVQKLISMAESDNGIRSLHFDFTEWSDGIKDLKKGQALKKVGYLVTPRT